MDEPFYGDAQAAIHNEAFGRLAALAADRLLAELAAAGLQSGTVVDLGCGSGILARRLGDAGYDVLGTDISAPMLEIAQRQAPGARFVHGSLWDLPLPPSVAVTSIGEALNYATDPAAGDPAFEALAVRVADALAPGGVFLFDVSVPGRSGPDRRRVQFHDRDCRAGRSARASTPPRRPLTVPRTGASASGRTRGIPRLGRAT